MMQTIDEKLRKWKKARRKAVKEEKRYIHVFVGEDGRKDLNVMTSAALVVYPADDGKGMLASGGFIGSLTSIDAAAIIVTAFELFDRVLEEHPEIKHIVDDMMDGSAGTQISETEDWA